ncbi:MAG: hypothetical protein ABH846_01590, partial [Patescibacteria group bacterium]
NRTKLSVFLLVRPEVDTHFVSITSGGSYEMKPKQKATSISTDRPSWLRILNGFRTTNWKEWEVAMVQASL